MITEKVEDIIQNNMAQYSTYILLHRALPDYRDGLKPVYRRILWAMQQMKATKFTKSANVTGEVFKYHSHGDTYPTVVGMVQGDRHIVPFITGKGSFGQYTSRDLAPAASRYTEIKLSEMALDMLKDVDKNIVNFIGNYDNTKKIPEVLPIKFPAVLAYAQSGIGVGFSSSLPSFNITELCDATEEYLKSGAKNNLIPDFATGGYIINDPAAFEKVNNEGLGSVMLRGKGTIDGNKITITEIPYSTTREAIIEKVVDLAKQGKLKEVTEIKDLTGLSGMRISIKARKNTDMELLLEKLYLMTPLQSSYSSNMNVVINGLPKVLGVWSLIEEWTNWRRNCIQRGINDEVSKMSKKLHILRGFEAVSEDVDRAIHIIRTSAEQDIEINLMKDFNIDMEQAVEVAEMKLKNINKEFLVKRVKSISDFEKTIENNKAMIDDVQKLNSLIIEGLHETKKKYGSDRKTEVIEIASKLKLKDVEEVADYGVTLKITAEGYCYKFKNNMLLPTLKPGDYVVRTLDADNASELLIFTDDFCCHKIKINELPDTSGLSFGSYLPTLIENKKVVDYAILGSGYKGIVFMYTNNKLAKVDIKSFEGNRKVLKNAYNDKQELLSIIPLKDNVNLMLTTTKTKITFNTSKVSALGSRSATGVYMTRKGESIKIEIV